MTDLKFPFQLISPELRNIQESTKILIRWLGKIKKCNQKGNSDRQINQNGSEKKTRRMEVTAKWLLAFLTSPVLFICAFLEQTVPRQCKPKVATNLKVNLKESHDAKKKKKPKEHRQHTHSTDSQTKIKHYTVSHSSGNQPLDTQTCFQAGKADKSKITQAVLSLDVSNPASFCSFPSMRRSEHFSLMVCPGPFCTKPSSSGGCCLAFSPWNCDIWHELRCLPTTLQPLCS